MKLFHSCLIALLLTLGTSSCSYIWNSKEVNVTIGSEPSGADIFIEGRNYGKTPAVIRIEPKNYNATLVLEGYGSANFQMAAWQDLRSKKADATRCILDSLLIFPVFSVYCREFKQTTYFIDIARSDVGAAAGASGVNSRAMTYSR